MFATYSCPVTRVLISGASVAGPALAFWLRRSGWEPVVVEQAPSLRTGGQNIDIRGAAREVVRRMGIDDAVAAATTGEQGVPGVEASVWNAFFLPKGTPEPIVRKLNKAMSDTLDNAGIRSKLEELGLEIIPPERRSPEYLAKYLPEEIERWAKPIREAGISAD